MPEDDNDGLLPQSYSKMKDQPGPSRPKTLMNKMSFVQIASYVLDWVVLIVLGVVGVIIGETTPNKRHFSLSDPNIAFPMAKEETVNSTWLLVANAAIPIVIILIVALVFVPGPTVPEGTPSSLIWKRKLWELHVGWLGLATALVSAWFITSGMKNLFGKPRPDMLDRCMPDVANWKQHLAGTPGGWQGVPSGNTYNGQLVAATICTSTNHHDLDDGFRSYPSGHSSSAAAGLIYLSFFLASKFNLTIPFVTHDVSGDKSAATAFPSRLRSGNANENDLAYANDPAVFQKLAEHNSAVTAARKQAATPPLYLMTIALLPFFTSIFIASSRWFDFRHHGFDILFGFIIGTITAWWAFRLYHLPLRSGAGWGWGPRSHDKAFWAGLGSYSWATDKHSWRTAGDEEERVTNSGIELGGLRHRPVPNSDYGGYESPMSLERDNRAPQPGGPYRPPAVDDDRSFS